MIRIGTSGYQYDHWRGLFYPAEIPKRRWFEFYAGQFDSVEINNSFYRLPSEKAFEAWREQAPPGFLYALKFSRYGSHRRRLMDPQNSVTNFITRADHLERHLGPILVQLPPRWHVNAERLEQFLAFAPRRYRWAVELRDPSWLSEEVYAVLKRHHAALCLHDMLPDHPQVLTARWVYLRFHGGASHEGAYSEAQLQEAAARLRAWRDEGHDVYAYFNNDQYGHAVRNALRLRELVGA